MFVLVLLIGLIVAVAPIAILVFIITAIVKKNKENKNNFDETIRNIYVYIILIITLVAIISGVIYTFKIGLDILLPEKTIYQSSSNDEQREMNGNIIEFCTTLALVVAVTPVFVYHNKIAKKSRENKIQEMKIEETNN